MGGGSRIAKEGIKDITKATEVKPLEVPPEDTFGATMPKAVIGGALIGVREHLVSLVYFLKFLLSPIMVVVVGVMLEGQLTESLLDLLIGGISVYTEDFIIIMI